jgi:hypothetical protein
MKCRNVVQLSCKDFMIKKDAVSRIVIFVEYIFFINASDYVEFKKYNIFGFTVFRLILLPRGGMGLSHKYF